MQEAKICVLTSVHPPFDVRIFHKECKALMGAGYHLLLVVPHERDEVRDGIRIRALAKPGGRLGRMTRTMWQVCREALRLDAEIYHFHDPELIPIALLLSLRGKKVIYDIHEDLPRAILSKHYLPRWIRRPLGWLAERGEKLACRHFAALVSATPVIAERFTGLNGHSVVVQNFPLLQELISLGGVPWSERIYSLAYIGNISLERGIREMVQAMGLLPDRFQATLKLAGNFSPPSLREEVIRLPGWRRVEALGFLDRPGVIELLRQVRVGLVLIHAEPQYQASYPIKMFEYMSAGIPVIASDFPLWREIVGSSGCGLLVDPLDVKAISEAIEFLLTNPQEAEEMGRRGRFAVEKHYNWASEERKLLQLYAKLMVSTSST